jgi:hypothetical protein
MLPRRRVGRPAVPVDIRDLVWAKNRDTRLASTPSDIIWAQGDDQFSRPAMDLSFPFQVLWKLASACLDQRL